MLRSLTRRQLGIAGIVSILTGIAVMGTDLAPAAAKGIFTTADNVAIEGYDPVAFFTDGKPVEGSAQFETDWQGATWRFASAEHLALFKADPSKYAPQYGGFCAYAASKGAAAPTVPEAWTIVDGKLYLNFSTGVRARWAEDIPGNIAKADANWPDIEKTLK